MKFFCYICSFTGLLTRLSQNGLRARNNYYVPVMDVSDFLKNQKLAVYFINWNRLSEVTQACFLKKSVM